MQAMVSPILFAVYHGPEAPCHEGLRDPPGNRPGRARQVKSRGMSCAARPGPSLPRRRFLLHFTPGRRHPASHSRHSISHAASPASEPASSDQQLSLRTIPLGYKRTPHEPDRLRAAAADHSDDAGAGPGAGGQLQHLSDAEGHLPVAQPAAALRDPQLRRDGPQADRGPDHQRLRAVLPVHQQRGARRVAVDPEHGDAQADLPAGDRHGRGDGPDGRLLQSGAVGHADRVVAALRGPARRGQPAGRLPGLREREPVGRRAPGHGAVPGPADVLRPGGRLVAAAVRRQRPHDRRQRRPRPPPLLQPLAPGRRQCHRQRQLHQPLGQRRRSRTS